MLEQAKAASGFRIKGLPHHWQQFGVCCVFHFIVPLLPFAIERFADGHISPATLTVGSAVYVLVIGNSSRNAMLVAISLFLGLIYIVLFGLLAGKVPSATTSGPSIIGWSVLIFALFHGIERFNRHVIERAPFWEFNNREDTGAV